MIQLKVSFSLKISCIDTYINYEKQLIRMHQELYLEFNYKAFFWQPILIVTLCMKKNKLKRKDTFSGFLPQTYAHRIQQVFLI